MKNNAAGLDSAVLVTSSHGSFPCTLLPDTRERSVTMYVHTTIQVCIVPRHLKKELFKAERAELYYCTVVARAVMLAALHRPPFFGSGGSSTWFFSSHSFRLLLVVGGFLFFY